MAASERQPDVFRLPGYFTFWLAETISGFGGHITTLALQVLVVLTLKGTATDVGLLNAARWLPYMLLGLVVGALIDRRPRRPVLIATDLGRALVLGAIPALWMLGWLSLPALMIFVALFGVMTLLNDAASQSFMPRLAPPHALLAANARLDQGAAVAQTSGPLVAGALVTALGAPLAVLFDAASYLFSALAMSRIRVTEPPAKSAAKPLRIRADIAEGLVWVYRHRTLAPLALSTHGWFVCNAMLGAIFVPFALIELRLTPFELGLTLAAAGGAGLLGAMVSTGLGLSWGAGRAVIASRALTPLAWAIIALAPRAADHWAIIALLALGQALYGFSLSAENANSMGYRQAVTPDALQGRMNATMRSINRAMIVIGAPLGGLLADGLGYGPTFAIAIIGFAVVPVVLAASPFRHARHDERPPAAPTKPISAPAR